MFAEQIAPRELALTRSLVVVEPPAGEHLRRNRDFVTTRVATTNFSVWPNLFPSSRKRTRRANGKYCRGQRVENEEAAKRGVIRLRKIRHSCVKVLRGEGTCSARTK
eukprot:6195908-Pleurochrysis_carterae.AAC.3